LCTAATREGGREREGGGREKESGVAFFSSLFFPTASPPFNLPPPYSLVTDTLTFNESHRLRSNIDSSYYSHQQNNKPHNHKQTQNKHQQTQQTDINE
jgi:hypothetical protein